MRSGKNFSGGHWMISGQWFAVSDRCPMLLETRLAGVLPIAVLFSAEAVIENPEPQWLEGNHGLNCLSDNQYLR
jgi:hypothetical protein